MEFPEPTLSTGDGAAEASGNVMETRRHNVA